MLKKCYRDKGFYLESTLKAFQVKGKAIQMGI